jgi:hypothetical protein
MTWGKIDDNLALHPKVMRAGNEAMGLWVRALSYACQQLTDGFISSEIVTVFGGDFAAMKLVDVGLWHIVEGGYEFNDWCEYQPTREQVLTDREAAKERMAKARAARIGSPEVRENFARSSATPTRPDPTPTTSKDVVKRGTRIPPDFALGDDLMAWAKATKPKVDVFAQTAAFKDYWEAIPGAKGVKLDWVKTWRNWIRNSRDAVSNDADMAVASADRERRLAGHREFVEDIARARANAEPPPECKHGKSIVQCVPCAKELAGVA